MRDRVFQGSKQLSSNTLRAVSRTRPQSRSRLASSVSVKGHAAPGTIVPSATATDRCSLTVTLRGVRSAQCDSAIFENLIVAHATGLTVLKIGLEKENRP